MKLNFHFALRFQLFITLMVALSITSTAMAEGAATQQAARDDPWSKTYVFQFEHDTFYVPAVWTRSATGSVPKYDHMLSAPDGTVYKNMTFITFDPLAPDWLKFPEALGMNDSRLVAGKGFLVHEFALYDRDTERRLHDGVCPKDYWQRVRQQGYFEDDVCSITCDPSEFGKKPRPESPFGTYCNVRWHLGYHVEYVWNGRYVDPATWENQDRRVQQLLDWLKTPPAQRPHYLPDLSPEAKP